MLFRNNVIEKSLINWRVLPLVTITTPCIHICFFLFLDNFAVVHGFSRPLFRHKSQKFQFDRNEDGTFTLIKLDEKNVSVTRSYIFDPSMYCIEHAATKTMNNFYLFQGTQDDRHVKFWYTRVAMAISCIFLTLTILYYCITEEKQKVFGRILISYCSALFLFYILLCLFAFKNTHPTGTPFCTSLGNTNSCPEDESNYTFQLFLCCIYLCQFSLG
jgi:hypothetical protein